ncbi:aldo/keto reductase [Amycolatopsis alkalitolerans]|uniref:Aldo/keto reductase n=1 Tax=Amycolatopsis alkalitolerans TaxID=2547244 RepID=A0A5C4LZE6_9PSEU|nr:aldo/keto reductase [Amycolatopsis alkalitolerans]TNC25184.1 aldo/keto reductase [Amycolatopsis alkalitolerans]
METRQLGHSGLQVSRVGLGTMMFGEMVSKERAYAQLDEAFAAGVTLVDTAEMYPVPLRPETFGRTEEIVGRWLSRTGRRADIVLSTKIVGPPPDQVVGPTSSLRYIRDGETRLTAGNIIRAVEGSLKRLGTDYLDLIHPHWPDRRTNSLKLRDFPGDGEPSVPIEETLTALDQLVRDGKVRAIAVSNETAWGLHRYQCAEDELGTAAVCAVQNAYNLLCRTYEVGLAEFAHRSGVPLVAYSPLAMGVLTGKYLHGARPAGARLSEHPHPRYTSPAAYEATEAYCRIAANAGMSPAALALRFVLSQPFVASVLIAASSLRQLADNLTACAIGPLDPAVLAAIEAVHERIPNPGP